MFTSALLEASPASPAAPIPRPQLDVRLDGSTQPQANELWRQALAPLFDLQLGHPPNTFRAQLGGVHLNQGLIAQCASDSPHRFRRSPTDIRRSQIDHLLVQCYVSGSVEGDYLHPCTRVPTGSVSLLDLGRTLDTRSAGGFCNLTLVVPRDRLPAALRGRQLHGQVLDPARASTRLLQAHLDALLRCGPSLDAEEASAGVDAALAMLAGTPALRESAPEVQASARRTLWRMVQAHVEACIDRGAMLSVDSMAREFHLSRATLYRLFAQEGGVQAYVQGRRLDRCFEALVSSDGHGFTLADLAYRHGFSSESSFSRAFRRRFSVSPRDARALAAAPPTGVVAPPAPSIDGWLGSLRPRRPAAAGSMAG